MKEKILRAAKGMTSIGLFAGIVTLQARELRRLEREGYQFRQRMMPGVGTWWEITPPAKTDAKLSTPLSERKMA